MKKQTLILIVCFIVIILIFLSFTVLPSFTNMLSTDNVKPLNVLIGLLYSIMLSHPYLRTAQLILNRSMKSKEQTFSDFQQKGMMLEYLISCAGKLLIVTVVVWMALTSLFRRMSIFHYLIIPLYGLSIIMLDLVTDKVVLQDKANTID